MEKSDNLDFRVLETREWLKSLLKSGVVTLNFTKNDGTKRKLKATLQESVLPKVETATAATTVRKQSDEVQPVYDLEAEGWRSFRWDSLTAVSWNDWQNTHGE